MNRPSFVSLRRARGFTMIELIVVIVILGILAAVALPRFTNLQRDARISKLNAARGAVQAAAAMVHGSAMAKGGLADTTPCPGAGNPGTANNANNGTLCTESGRVQMVNLYPAANNINGILNAAGLTSQWITAVAQLNPDGYQATVGATANIRVLGGVNPATCSFTYTNAAPNAAPVISAVNTAGC